MKYKNKKRAEGLPLNIIIVAVILLIVLVIVIGVFRSNFFKFTDDLQSCGVRGGEWLTKDECDSKGGKVLGGLENKNDKNQKCCIVLLSKDKNKK